MDARRIVTVPLLREAFETQRSLAEAASLTLRLDTPEELPALFADPDHVLQVFENLLGNALKFTAPGREITLGAAARAGELLFYVRDTGKGIPEDQLPHLFDRFWQANKEERKLGAGLGLAIVKGIIEAHHGRIWVESELGRGTTFFFTLPTAAPAETFREIVSTSGH